MGRKESNQTKSKLRLHSLQFDIQHDHFLKSLFLALVPIKEVSVSVCN